MIAEGLRRGIVKLQVASNLAATASLEAMLSTDSDGVLVPIRVKPRAPAAKISGERDGRLLVQVTAAPVDGKANDAVCRLLAKSLKIAGGRIRVVGGERAREKLVRIDGMASADVARALGILETGT